VEFELIACTYEALFTVVCVGHCYDLSITSLPSILGVRWQNRISKCDRESTQNAQLTGG